MAPIPSENRGGATEPPCDRVGREELIRHQSSARLQRPRNHGKTGGGSDEAASTASGDPLPPGRQEPAETSPHPV